MSHLIGHPLAAFTSAGDPDAPLQRSLREANIIIGRDIASHQEFIIFGRDVLTEIAAGRSLPQRPLCIEFHKDSDELSNLLEYVRIVKGRVD